MKTTLTTILSLISILILSGCDSQSKNRIYVLIGTESPEFESAIEGVATQCIVTGPGPDEPYGEVTIKADGKEKGKSQWGGSVCEVGASASPPSVIELHAKTLVPLYFGVIDMHADTGEGILLKKGVIYPKDDPVIIRRNQTTLTYEVDPVVVRQ